MGGLSFGGGYFGQYSAGGSSPNIFVVSTAVVTTMVTLAPVRTVG